MPFRQLGQYEDVETGLYYNRFRYYDCNTGTYISKDPISILGGLNVYAYVFDSNTQVDVLGLLNAGNPYGIPRIDAGFREWFDTIHSDQFDSLWGQKGARNIIESRLRYPGKMHEWLMVGRANTFKRWGISFDDIQALRTPISEVKFINPTGIHGGIGSTMAHNELLAIIDSSNDYNTFVRRLNNWANYRLKGGADALPEKLKICKK